MADDDFLSKGVVTQFWFSIRSVQLGDHISVHYATRTHTVDWEMVDEVFVERRHTRVNGVQVEEFQLNLSIQGDSICITINPQAVSSIISLAKAYAPDKCRVSDDIRNVRVRH